MERMYPLAYLQHMSVHRAMEWDLSKSISGMSLGKLSAMKLTLSVTREMYLGYIPGWSGLSTR